MQIDETSCNGNFLTSLPLRRIAKVYCRCNCYLQPKDI